MCRGTGWQGALPAWDRGAETEDGVSAGTKNGIWFSREMEPETGTVI